MDFRNTERYWGLVSIILHWLVAVVVLGLFGLGLYMVELNYYDSMYKTVPYIHKSIGILLFITVIFRLVWRVLNVTPQAMESHKAWEVSVAHWVHRTLYGLLIVLMSSGYLISTADGRAISVFDWFDIPSIVSGIDNLEDLAGLVHEFVAYALISMVVLHALGAFKHHLLDKDRTLLRMLGKNSQS